MSSFATDLFADVDRKDAALFAKYLADDAVFRFANADEVVGRDNIESTLAAFYDQIKALHHDRQGLYEVDDTAVVWSDVTYTRFDDAQVTVPVVTIIKRNDEGLIVDYRIFMDAGPLFA
jgi:ketosteroid isomerase-like protein